MMFLTKFPKKRLAEYIPKCQFMPKMEMKLPPKKHGAFCFEKNILLSPKT
jgi:hypothetical protein